MFGWGVDIIAISQLAVKVHAACKDAPGDYSHISEEVLSLQIIIDQAGQYFESTPLNDKDRRLGQKVLKGCESVLEDINSFVNKYNSAKTRQIFKRVILGSDDIGTLRARLISNTGLLNRFIQR